MSPITVTKLDKIVELDEMQKHYQSKAIDREKSSLVSLPELKQQSKDSSQIRSNQMKSSTDAQSRTNENSGSNGRSLQKQASNKFNTQQVSKKLGSSILQQISQSQVLSANNQASSSNRLFQKIKVKTPAESKD